MKQSKAKQRGQGRNRFVGIPSLLIIFNCIHPQSSLILCWDCFVIESSEMSEFTGEKNEELNEEEKKAIAAAAEEDDGLPDDEEELDDSGKGRCSNQFPTRLSASLYISTICLILCSHWYFLHSFIHSFIHSFVQI